MAAILQFRQGSKSSFISSGPYISEPFFDTDTNIIHIGVSGSSSITLTKLEDINSGSFSVSGDISGSNLYLSGDITASNTLLSGDITIGGNIILGDQVQDNITVSGQFDSDLIPSSSGEYDLGSTTKKWNHLYAVSASIDSVDLVANLPSGVVSSSAQIASYGFDNYSAWAIRGDNNVSVYIGSSATLNFTGGKGIETETVSSPTALITLDTGSNHFITAVEDISFTALPDGTVSGSQQVINLLPSGVISGSTQLPSGLISGSSQVVESLPTGTVSGSVQVLGGTNIVSSSVQVINFLPSGTVSGSSQITNGSYILSSSIQLNGFDSYSNDVDLRLDNLEGPVSFSVDLLNAVSHSHSNKGFLDTIDQDLSQSANATFNDLHINGTGSFANEVTIYGNLTVLGTETIINTTNLAIEDNMLYLNSGSTITNPDLGWAGNYNDGTYAHAGIFRDASDGKFKFFDSYTPEPEGSIDTSHGSFNYAPIFVASVDATGDIVTTQGNVTGINFVGTGSQLVFPGTDIISSSQQVIDFLPSGIISSSNQITNLLPQGTVSGSDQVLGGTNIVSSSQQVINYLPQGTVSGSVQVLGGTNIVSSSQQVINYLPQGTVSGSTQIIEILQDQTPGLVSGSDQVTASLDLRYANLGGDNLLSSSNETFEEYSSSVDVRLLDTFSSGSDTSQSLHILVGNFPTSGSLGTAAFYNVSSSLGDDGSVIPNVKAVYDYINNTIGAADITGVSASLGLSGGGNAGYVSLSLDTASAHFTDGVQKGLPSGVISGSGQISFPSSDNYGGWYVDGDNTNPIYVSSGRTVDFEGRNGIITEARNPGNYYISIDLDTGSAHFQEGVELYSSTLPSGVVSGSSQVSYIGLSNIPQGIISGSSQITNLLPSGIISGSSQIDDRLNAKAVLSSSNTYIDANDFSFGGAPANVAGLNQFTLRDDNAGYSGLLSFQDGTATKSFDYVASDVRYIDTNTGVSIAIKPDADGTKSWVFDTDGDLVSNGGSWTSGNAYMNNLIASSSVTASNMLVDNDITANNFIGNIQSTNGVISGSSQLTSTFDTRYVTLSGTQTISGTKTFNDIVVNGTGSFAYIESTAGSAKIIGDAFIVLNNDTPTSRYAGLAVYDSGSANTTASLQFDGQTNDWFYEYSDDGGVTTDHGVVLFGPEYSGIGSPTYPTNNNVQKGTGGHHLADSNITDNGTTITLGSNTNVSGVLTATTFDGLVSQSLLNDLTNGEVNQLKNIDTETISNTQWGYLGATDQGLATTNTVTFNEVSSSNGFTSTAQRGLLVDNGDGYVQIGSGTVKTYIGQDEGSGYGYIQTGDSGFNSDELRILVGGTTMMHLSKADASDSGTDAVQIKNTDFAVDYDTLFVDASTNRVGIETLTPTTTLDVNGNISGSEIHATGQIKSESDIVAYASSDRRLKDEIQPISDPISKINQIGGYSFVWNTEKQNIYNGKDYGVIAQEIEEILPELVNTRENGYKAVKYDKLVSLLIEGIKELSKEVEDLKKKIN